MKMYIHNRVKFIQIQFQFHEVLITGYLVMANFTDFKSIFKMAITYALLKQSGETYRVSASHSDVYLL